jgi:hypothetical protein
MENKSNTNELTKNKQEYIEDVMKDLEQKVNPKTMNEGVNILMNAVSKNDPSSLLVPIQLGAKEFEERSGRALTYSEMRAMWG